MDTFEDEQRNCGKVRTMTIGEAIVATEQREAAMREKELSKGIHTTGSGTLGTVGKDGEDLNNYVSGAKSSGSLSRYDLIPREALESLARRFTLGSVKYGDFNYVKGLRDKEYIVDRINHIFKHLQALVAPRTEGEQEDDNIGAILWGAAFLAEVQAVAPGLLRQIRRERTDK